MTTLKFRYLEDTLEEYDLLLFDLWGVIVEGGKIYTGVVDVLNRLIKKKRIVFLSNAPRPDFIVARNLGNRGIQGISPGMVITSGDIARREILKFTNPKIYHLGSDRNNDLLLEINHRIVNELHRADIFLLSLYRDENENIDEFNELLKKVASTPSLISICSNPDTTIPNCGITRYCPGYYGAIIEKQGGEVIYTGKPHACIYDEVLSRHSDISKERILMIGDTFGTDILGAKNAGIHAALVLTGNSIAYYDGQASIENKLAGLYNAAGSIGAMPDFVTQIVK